MRGLKFGVEIECIMPECYELSELCDKMCERGVVLVDRSSHYGYSTRVPGWQVTYDTSLRTRTGKGVEVISPVLYGESGLNQLELILTTLTEEGFTVNISCGLHVHHDCNDYTGNDLVSLANLYHAHGTGLNSILAPSRRNSHKYCSKFTNIEVRRLNEYVHASTDEVAGQIRSRYKALNIKSFIKRGTVEFRQHQGSLNYAKIEAWIVLTFLMVNYAKANTVVEPSHTRKTLNQLLKVLKLDGTYVGNFLKVRADEFKQRATGNTQPQERGDIAC